MKSLKLVESLVNDIGKFVDKKDIFYQQMDQHDELLSSTSIGRIFTLLAEKAIQVDDLDKAYLLVVQKAFLQTLIESAEHYGFTNNISNFVFIPSKEYSADIYYKNYLEKNEIFLDAINSLENYLKDELSTKDIQRLINFIKKHFRVNITQIFSEKSIVFKKFFDYVGSDTHIEKSDLFQKDTYYSQLKEEYISKIFDDLKGMTLKDIYIEPEFNIHKKCFRDGDERCNTQHHFEDKLFFKHSENINLHQYINDVINEKNSLSLKEKKVDIVYLFGYPGQGKSSFCKRFMYDVITEKNVYKQNNIYLLRLRDVKNPKELIDDPYGTIKKELEKNIGSKVFNFDNSILVLDGLDELYMKQGISSSDVESFCLNINREQEKQKTNYNHNSKRHKKHRITLRDSYKRCSDSRSTRDIKLVVSFLLHNRENLLNLTHNKDIYLLICSNLIR